MLQRCGLQLALGENKLLFSLRAGNKHELKFQLQKRWEKRQTQHHTLSVSNNFNYHSLISEHF